MLHYVYIVKKRFSGEIKLFRNLNNLLPKKYCCKPRPTWINISSVNSLKTELSRIRLYVLISEHIANLNLVEPPNNSGKSHERGATLNKINRKLLKNSFNSK